MNELYAYTPQIWPSALMILLLIVLAIYTWYRRGVPGALPFLMSCLFGTLMMAGMLLTYLAVNPETKIFWFRFESSWYLPAASAITCFILEYAWPGRWLTRRNLILLSIFPVLGFFYYFTAGRFPSTDSTFVVSESVTAKFSPVSRIFVIYVFTLALINLIAFAWLFLHSPRHRWPVILMAASQIAARTILLGNTPSLEANIFHIPILALPFVSYAIALFGFRIFDPIPLARQQVIAQMNDGVLVLDDRKRVASLNPVAEQILCVSTKQIKGKPVRELLPAYPNEDPAESCETEFEFNIGVGHEIRHFSTVVSLLKDFRGPAVGQVLLLRDVTEQKRVQLQILEQQQVLATLQERERLARELHDSLGQTLAAAHLQASTARVFLAQGETAQTDECLKQMADMTIAAEADVREYLLGAKVALSPATSFFDTLREYVTRFSRQYGLQAELHVPPQLEAQGLGLEVGVQCMRIIQEALSNVRKHAHAKNIQVTFTVLGQMTRITISDDGQGFEFARVVQQSERFGLQAMRERAETLGGSFEVISHPGQGTQVTVLVPIRAGISMGGN